MISRWQFLVVVFPLHLVEIFVTHINTHTLTLYLSFFGNLDLAEILNLSKISSSRPWWYAFVILLGTKFRWNLADFYRYYLIAFETRQMLLTTHAKPVICALCHITTLLRTCTCTRTNVRMFWKKNGVTRLSMLREKWYEWSRGFTIDRLWKIMNITCAYMYIECSHDIKCNMTYAVTRDSTPNHAYALYSKMYSSVYSNELHNQKKRPPPKTAV